MNKVITINLNGRAYQLEEAGYDALRKYLDEARAALRDDPDRDEVMADFEQAVADKCDACLKGVKNVVSAKEIEEIIAKMGPVDGGAHANGGGAGAAGAAGTNGAQTAIPGAAPKRLYRIMEGSMLRGVCTGIAAYFNIDAALVRVLFVLLTIFTGGGWAIAYIVLVIVLPVARTADEVAQAHGEPPFTAKDFIDRTRAEYEKYKTDPGYDKNEIKQRMHAWRDEWHAKRRAWRDERRKQRQMTRAEWRAERREHDSHDRGCHGGGFGTLIGVIITVALTIFCVIALWSLIFHGVVFGHALGAGHALWVPLLFLISVFYIVSFPFRHLIHNEHHCHRHDGNGFFVILFLVLFVYTAIVLFPPVRDVWNSLIMYLQSVRT